MNRFKVLDLVNRVPKVLWTDVHDIVQETSSKTIPKKKKCKWEKWLSEEVLQTAEERREVKSKEERERYVQLNAEFLKTARRDKKAFFNEQCKEIEENSRKGKTRDLLRKIGNIKGIFHPKTVTIKDTNGKDLIEVEKIKERCKEHTEELYKKDLNDWDNPDCLVSHSEPDILECEVKWALQSIAANKASGGDGIPAELFKILNKVKVAQSCPNLCNPWTIRSMEFSRPKCWSG